MKKAQAFFLYGAGGAALDPTNGMALLQRKVRALGIATTNVPYADENVSDVIAAINKVPADTLVISGGDSCGANLQGYISQNVTRQIDYMFGIQPSLWCGMYPIAPTVKNVLCIYNSWWWMTAGLGSYKLILASGNTTTRPIRYWDVHDWHPGDDNPTTQDFILTDIKRIVA